MDLKQVYYKYKMKYCKRILVLLVLPLLSIAGENNTTALKTSTCNIGIDLGHSPIKYGSTSARGNKEYDFNRRMGTALFYELQKRNIGTFFVNQMGKEVSLEERTEEINRLNPTILISLHHDSVKEQYLKKWIYKNKSNKYCDSFTGYSLFISKKNPRYIASRIIADNIGKSLIGKGYLPSYHHTMKIKGENKPIINSITGVFLYNNLVVLKNSKVPAVLLECGIIVNREDEMKLLNKNYVVEFAETIALGLAKSCSDLEK